MGEGGFRRFVCGGACIALLASGLIAYDGVRLVSAQDITPNPGKANPLPDGGPGRTLPPVRVGDPVGFAGPIEAPKGDGVPAWAGKTDEASKRAAKDGRDAGRGKAVSAAASVEGSDAAGTLIDKSKNTDGEAPKIGSGKNRVQKRAAQTEVDDPVRDPADVRAPKPARQPKANGPKPPVVGASPVIRAVNPKPGGKPNPPSSVSTTKVVFKPTTNRKLIDLNPVVATPDFTVENGDLVATNGSVALRLSDLDDPNGAVQLSSGDAQAGLRPVGSGKRNRPTGAGRRVATQESKKGRWADAFADGSVLTEEIAGRGTKGSIVVEKRDPNSPGVWEFELTLSEGLNPVVDGGGVVAPALRIESSPVRILDAAGATVFEIPVGVARDASGSETGVNLDLQRATGDRWIVRVSVDRAWLSDRARTYPIEIDPTIVVPAPAGGLNATSVDGIVGAFHPYTSDMISDQWWFGSRNLMQTFNLSSLGSNPSITNAVLNTHVGNCDAPNSWSPYAFSVGVSPNSTAYLPGQVVPAPLASPIFLRPTQYGAVLQYNISSWVQAWSNSSWANNGVRFEMERWPWTGQPNFCELFVDSLVVDVANRLPTGSLVSPADGATNVALQPTLSATASDPDGQSLLYYFKMCYPSIVAPVYCAESGWQAAAAWTMPDALPYFSGAAYEAWAWDGAAQGYLGRFGFTTLPRPNGAPNIVSATGPASGSLGNAIRQTLSASATDPNGDPLQYALRICSYGCPVGGDWFQDFQSSSTWTTPSDLPYGTNLAWAVYVRDVPPAGATQQATSYGWVSFNTLLRPNNAPGIPDLSNGSAATPVNSSVNVSNSPSFVAGSTDPDGDPVKIQYTVCPATGTCVVSPFVYGAWSPAPGLAFNTVYTWSAVAEDMPPATAQGPLRSAASVTRTFATGANPANGVSAPLPVAPTGTLAAPGAVTNHPILQARSGDSDGDPFEYQFMICSPGIGVPAAQCSTSPWRSTPHWQVAAYLDWNTYYEWKAWARNTSDPLGQGVPMVTSQFVKVTVASSDDIVGGVSGFNPYVEIDTAAGDGGGVNEAVGQLTYPATDVSIPSVTNALQVNRTYNSRLRTKGAFGLGWTSNLDAKLVYKANFASFVSDFAPVEVILPDGRREYFSRNSNGTYVSATPGFFSELTRDASQNFIYVRDDRSKFVFDANGVLVRFEDKNGNFLVYSYTGTAPNQQLNQITDSKSGRSLTFLWTAGKVSSVETQTVAAHASKLTWSYSYTGDALTGVCPPTSASPPVSGCWGMTGPVIGCTGSANRRATPMSRCSTTPPALPLIRRSTRPRIRRSRTRRLVGFPELALRRVLSPSRRRCTDRSR
jgi:Domain of unknown function (DUF6531)